MVTVPGPGPGPYLMANFPRACDMGEATAMPDNITTNTNAVIPDTEPSLLYDCTSLCRSRQSWPHCSALTGTKLGFGRCASNSRPGPQHAPSPSSTVIAIAPGGTGGGRELERRPPIAPRDRDAAQRRLSGDESAICGDEAQLPVTLRETCSWYNLIGEVVQSLYGLLFEHSSPSIPVADICTSLYSCCTVGPRGSVLVQL